MKKHRYFYRDKLYKISKNLIFAKNYNILKKNVNIKSSIRQKVIFVSFTKSFKINKNNIKKFCLLTGRLRSMAKNSKLNRLNFRELVSNNSLPGIYKK